MYLREREFSYLHFLLLLFASILFPVSSFATPQTRSFINSQKPVLRKKPPQKKIKPKVKKKHIPYSYRRAINAPNASIWGGVGFLFVNQSLQPYVTRPTLDYQIGVAKSMYNVTPHTFLYFALIADFAYSRKSRYSCCSVQGYYASLYYFSNEQLVLGYEQSLGTSFLSMFVEAGGAFEQRYFAIRNNNNASMIDYIFVTTGGGSFNAGFNIKLFPEHRTLAFFRLAMNLMVSPFDRKTLNCTEKTIKVNQLSYMPSVSFGLRL